MGTNNGQRAAIYARISESRDLNTLGVERQVSACKELASREGYTVVDVFQDLNISAYSGHDRPAFSDMLSAVKAGRVDVVLAYAPDRLARNLGDYAAFTSVLASAGAVLHSVNGGLVRPGDANQDLASGVQALVATWESSIKSTRVKSKMEQRARAGLPSGGARSFGYSPSHLELVEPEATALAQVVRNVLAGASVRSQAKALNDQGLLTPSRKRADGTEKGCHLWNGSNLRSAILRPALAGLVTYQGEVLDGVEAKWPAIITPAEHYRLVALLSDPTRRTNRDTAGRTPKYLGVGIYRCGNPACDGHMVTTFQNRPGGRVKMYRCRYSADKHSPVTGGHTARRLDLVDQVVEAAIIQRLADPALRETLTSASDNQDQAAKAMTGLAEVDQAMADLAEALGAGAMTVAQFSTANAGLMARRETLERELASLDTSGVLDAVDWSVPAYDFWHAAPLETKRSLVDTLATVTILPARPGRRFDPDSVEVAWKF